MPPTRDAEAEFQRQLRSQMRMQEIDQRKRQEAAEAASATLPSHAVRTTADPRPNAYIPDELGIPKPYGALAPFKPTETGSTMRHIRKPQPREIEL